MLVAVKVDEVALPPALVAATQLYTCGLLVQPLAAKVSLAPLAGPVNVTDAPDTALPLVSVTSATSGLGKAVLAPAVCPLPDTVAMVVAVPAVMLKALALLGAVYDGLLEAVSL